MQMIPNYYTNNVKRKNCLIILSISVEKMQAVKINLPSPSPCQFAVFVCHTLRPLYPFYVHGMYTLYQPYNSVRDVSFCGDFTSKAFCKLKMLLLNKAEIMYL